jgi:hypothetical protein
MKPDDMHEILDRSLRQVHSWYVPLRISGRVWYNAYRYGGWDGIKEVAGYISRANKFDWNQGPRFLPSPGNKGSSA